MNLNKKKNIDSNEGYRNAIAASFACLIEQILYPLEIIEARLQSHDGHSKNNIVPHYKNIVNATLQIAATEGIRGFYRGVLVNLLSTNIGKTIFFGLYGKQKHKYQLIYGKHRQLPTILASIEASCFTSILTNPSWVIRTRIMLCTKDASIKQICREIYKESGVLGFYRGLGISIFLSIQTGLQLSLYEYLNYLPQNMRQGISQVTEPAYNATISKLIVSVVLYPFCVMRTRVQQPRFFGENEEKYKGAWSCIKKTYRCEGFGGFYKGFFPNTLRTLPSNALFFCCYELVKDRLPF